MSYIKLKKEVYFTWPKYFVAGISFVLIAGIILFNYSIYKPIPFQALQMNQIYKQIKSISSQNSTVVNIPFNYSLTGKGYITIDEKTQYFFVPRWIGRRHLMEIGSPGDNWIEGYLYSPDRLSVSKSDSWIIINVPSPTAPWRSRQDKGYENVEMYVRSQVAPNWYIVDSFE